jgi:hypothetical protein
MKRPIYTPTASDVIVLTYLVVVRVIPGFICDAWVAMRNR